MGCLSARHHNFPRTSLRTLAMLDIRVIVMLGYLKIVLLTTFERGKLEFSDEREKFLVGCGLAKLAFWPACVELQNNE